MTPPPRPYVDVLPIIEGHGYVFQRRQKYPDRDTRYFVVHTPVLPRLDRTLMTPPIVGFPVEDKLVETDVLIWLAELYNDPSFLDSSAA